MHIACYSPREGTIASRELEDDVPSAEKVRRRKELESESGFFGSMDGVAKFVRGDAVAGLVQSIQYGSKGKWGRIPMPAHAQLSADELKMLANWVMTIKK